MPNCGVVDIGSNTIRLSIYRFDHSGFQLLLDKKETVGLAGYIRDGLLSPEGIASAAGILGEYHVLLENLGIHIFHIFATASLRGITNQQEALSAFQAAAGIPVSVLSGAEEAALSFRGCFHNVSPADGPGLFADIGGGSTELVVHEGNVIRSEISLPLGSLALYSRHVSGLFPSKAEADTIRRRVGQALDKADVRPCPHLRGVGGTIRTAARLCGAQPGTPLPAGCFPALYQRLSEGGQPALRQILQVAPDRIHTLLPGLIIFNSLLERYEVQTVDVSPQGVREGYLLTHIMNQ